MSADLFSHAAEQEGMRRRDQGIARVQANNPKWAKRAYQELVRLAKLKPELHSNDMLHFDPPPNKHTSGGLWSTAIRRGLIMDTGRTARSCDPKKHAKRTPVYLSMIYASASVDGSPGDAAGKPASL